jgi:hypothetical protein
MKLSKLFVLTLLCVCLIAGSVFAQRLTGRITGTVSDADGASLPGVTVEISSPSLMGGVQSQITSVNGDLHARFQTGGIPDFRERKRKVISGKNGQ